MTTAIHTIADRIAAGNSTRSEDSSTPCPVDGIDAVIGVLAALGDGLSLYAGPEATHRIGGNVNVRAMQVLSQLYVTLEVHQATPELWAWAEAQGATERTYHLPDGTPHRTRTVRYGGMAIDVIVHARRGAE